MVENSTKADEKDKAKHAKTKVFVLRALEALVTGYTFIIHENLGCCCYEDQI
jgi:hypothetical protein